MGFAIRINGIAQQVQQHLLEQHPVGVNQRQIIRQAILDRHLTIAGLPGTQAHRFAGHLAGVERLHARAPLAQKRAQALDHLRGVIGMHGDPLQALGHPLGCRRIAAQSGQITLARIGVIDHCRQRLIHFMGDARRQLTRVTRRAV
jgi:hypothetical protein